MSLLKSMIDYNSDLEQFEEKETGIGVKETVEKFFKDRPYFVKESTGGGARGNTSGTITKNVFKDGTITEQAALIRENKALAEKQAKEAGITL
jgi:hypothetical protein